MTTWNYIFTALIGLALSVAATVVCRLIKKKWLTPLACFAALCPILGYLIMMWTADVTTLWEMVKTMTIWAFVIFMILINVKCLIFSTKRDVGRGKSYVNIIKQSMFETKKIFGRTNTEEDTNDKTDTQQ